MDSHRLIHHKVFADRRGSFFELFNQRHFETLRATGGAIFVQDNFSISKRGVLRGLHYQIRRAQGKLVSALSGSIFDVVVDLRVHSENYGKAFSVVLDVPHVSLWIPPGYAHGFLALTDANVSYKVTEYYEPDHERTIRWNDPALGIDWPTVEGVTLSDKDMAGLTLADAMREIEYHR